MRTLHGFMAMLLLGLGLPVAAQEPQQRGERLGDVGDQDFDENGLPRKLPKLPNGMTMETINRGSELFRGKGGCQTCHGQFGEGMPALGKSLASGLAYTPANWQSIDSLIKAGLPQPLSRTPVAMPPRGVAQNLTNEETRLIAAYVWAISQVQGEPWPGGRRKPPEKTRADAR
jgi:mono/diheme cytochrome c family protein